MTKAEKLREEILGKTKEYYELVHKPFQMAPFVEGQSRINYAGRVFDEKEMVNLVDSSLEFWLTYGRYSAEFEKRLAGYLGVRWSCLVNSGSSANLLAFMALTSALLEDRRIKRGDEVITVAAGFPQRSVQWRNSVLSRSSWMLNWKRSILMHPCSKLR